MSFKVSDCAGSSHKAPLLFLLDLTQTVKVSHFASWSPSPISAGPPSSPRRTVDPLQGDCHGRSAQGKGLYLWEASPGESPLPSHLCLLFLLPLQFPQLTAVLALEISRPFSHVGTIFTVVFWVCVVARFNVMWTSVSQIQFCTSVTVCDKVFTDLQRNKGNKKNTVYILQARCIQWKGWSLIETLFFLF